MGEDCLGMRRSPAIRQHLIQPRVVPMEAEKKVAQIAPWFDSMTLRASQDRVQHGGSAARGFMAQKQPILAADRLMVKRPLADVVVDRQTTIFYGFSFECSRVKSANPLQRNR